METIRFSLLSIPFDIHSGRLEGHFFIFDDEELNLVTDFLEDTYQGRLLWIRGNTKTILNTPLGTRYLNFIGHNVRGFGYKESHLRQKCSQKRAIADENSPVLPELREGGRKTQSGVMSSMTDRTWWRSWLSIGGRS